MAEKLGKASEIPEGTGKGFDVAGRKIAVFKIGGTFYAIDSACTHKGGPLEEGVLKEKVVTCPWHGATFNVATGEALGKPAPFGVAAHKIVLKDEDLYVELAEARKTDIPLDLSDRLDGDTPFSYRPFLDWLDAGLRFKTKLYGVLPIKMLAQSASEADFDLGEIHITEQDLKELSRLMDEARKKWGTSITYCLYHTSHLPGHMLINVRGPKAPTSLAMDIKF